MRKLKNCPLCNTTEANFKYELTAKDLLLSTEYTTTILKCNICNLYFANPMPSKDETFNFYPDKYTYYQPYRRKLTLRQKLYRIISYPIRDGIPKASENDEKLLDIGAGNFKISLDAIDLGYEVIAMEFSSFARTDLKVPKLKIVSGDFETYEFNAMKFNIIIMRHILEHLTKPLEALQKAKSLLKENGRIILTIPNINSTAWRLFRQYWYALDAPRHLFWFSPRTIIKYAEKANLKVLRTRYVSFIPQFTGSFSLFMKSKNFPSIIQRLIILILFPIGWILSLFLNLVKKGDIIEVTLQNSK